MALIKGAEPTGYMSREGSYWPEKKQVTKTVIDKPVQYPNKVNVGEKPEKETS